VLSREEKRKIYRYLLDRVKKGYKFAVRDLLLYLVMIHTGRRVTEILSLTVKDFDLERKEIIFRKKKGKKNINEPVPAGDLVFKFFNIYLARIARDPTCVGKSGHGNRYKVFDGRLFPFNTRSNVAKMVRRWGYEAGLDRPIYPHLLRATAASDIYDITHDEDVVKKIGGWDSSEWKSYVRRPEERIVKLVREFHRITDNLFSGVKP
jgi:integrase